jgi:methenyltetrahydromethanopterin cyclohydrolase
MSFATGPSETVTPPTLNERAWAVVDQMLSNAGELGIAVHSIGGAQVLDCGVHATGGIAAGLELARVCLADLAIVSLVPGTVGERTCDHVAVSTDWPVEACKASQYAGWRIKIGDYFAMASGPMRAHRGKEALYDSIGGREKASVAVGVLETSALPSIEVVGELSRSLRLAPDRLRLLAARAASPAGMVQIAARALETALHKLLELKLDIRMVEAGWGFAPVPPVPASEIDAMARGNDSVLYGGQVAMWVRGDLNAWREIGPQVVSSSSRDYGLPFVELFERAGRDFYRVDPLLFSPATLRVHHLPTGECLTFGRINEQILVRSFYQAD